MRYDRDDNEVEIKIAKVSNGFVYSIERVASPAAAETLIAVDLDGVLADVTTRMKKIYAEKKEAK